MHALRRHKKSACLTTALMFFAMQCAPLQAGLVSTEAAFEQAQILVVNRAELLEAIDRDDVRADLIALAFAEWSTGLRSRYSIESLCQWVCEGGFKIASIKAT